MASTAAEGRKKGLAITQRQKELRDWQRMRRRNATHAQRVTHREAVLGLAPPHAAAYLTLLPTHEVRFRCLCTLPPCCTTRAERSRARQNRVG